MHAIWKTVTFLQNSIVFHFKKFTNFLINLKIIKIKNKKKKRKGWLATPLLAKEVALG
jgi:hypothetical protein